MMFVIVSLCFGVLGSMHVVEYKCIEKSWISIDITRFRGIGIGES